MENIVAVKEFMEVLRNEPKKAFDFIASDYYRFSKNDLVLILKEVLYAVQYELDCDFYNHGNVYKGIMSNVCEEIEQWYEEDLEELER